MKSVLNGLLVAVAVGLGGCQNQRPTQAPFDRSAIDPLPEYRASANIAESFSVLQQVPKAPAPQLSVTSKNFWIQIAKTALEKEFLFQGETITQSDPSTMKPQFHSIKSRVVFFRQRAGTLLLLEATQGHTAITSLPQTFVLAQFPIISQTDTDITFDFAAGMTALLVVKELRAMDFDGNDYQDSWIVTPARISYIDDAHLASNKELVIRQIAQLVQPSGQAGTIATPTVEMRYYISPYGPDPSFVPLVQPGLRLVGFFDIAALQRVNGDTIQYAVKFNDKQPITYAVSANTPAEYRQTIREAILYWNKAFGREVVRVVDGPPEVTAPDNEYNLIQWVDHDAAGNAYADAQMDPRTGQILHAQVMLNSVFPFKTKDRVRAYLKRIFAGRAIGDPGRHLEVSLQGFQQPVLCSMSVQEIFGQSASAIREVLDDDSLSDEAIMKIAKDVLRATVAHEVGHTLGLRHNFAGSLAANYRLAERNDFIQQYLLSGRAPDITVTSSIMEYMRAEDTLFTGERLLKDPKALSYDEKAIQWLYNGKTFSPSEIPPFCTDSGNKQYLDCVASDAGSSPVEYAQWAVEENLRILPYTILEAYVRRKTPALDSVQAVAVENVHFNTDYLASEILEPRYHVMHAFTGLGRLWSVRRNYTNIDEYNEAEVRAQEQDELKKEFAKHGGVAGVLKPIPAEYYQKAYERFVALLDEGGYASGQAPGGKNYVFTEGERATIKENVRAIFKRLPLAVTRQEIRMLSGRPFTDFDRKDKTLTYLGVNESPMDDGSSIMLSAENYERTLDTDLSNDLVSFLKNRVDEYVFNFGNPLDIRIGAATLLRPSRGQAPDFAYLERLDAKKRFVSLLEQNLGSSLKDLKPEELSKIKLRWWLENQQVLKSFDLP